MPVRGVRGAITASENSKESILSATKKLLEEMIVSNKIQKNDIASAFLQLQQISMQNFQQLLHDN